MNSSNKLQLSATISNTCKLFPRSFNSLLILKWTPIFTIKNPQANNNLIKLDKKKDSNIKIFIDFWDHTLTDISIKGKKLSSEDNFTKMISKMLLGIISLFLMLNGARTESNKWVPFLLHLRNQISSLDG